MFNGNRNGRNRSGKYTPRDTGPFPNVVSIRTEALRNDNFRAAVWTGEHLQATVMSIMPGEDIGLEIHPDTDQFFYIMLGRGVAMMGESMDNLDLESPIFAGDAIFVPAGTWHNLANVSRSPLKFVTIYAPPEHPAGTVHPTKADAEADEESPY
jgi:mannose-6-phosphate isomerase-like protein (cupin superfamily)